MDVLYFLKDRTRLIRQYYECAAQPFKEIMRKIEAEEEQYVPPYSEDGEPRFLSEWVDAAELLEVTGRCCISMLAASLQLYFKTWEHELRLNCGKDFAAAFKKEGLVGGYRACFAERLRIDWSSCPADLAVIEQVVLARNRDQHPESITTVRVTHAEKDWQRYLQPFFLNEREAELFQDGDGPSLFMSPSLHVSRDKLMTAIDQVERLCEWLEEKMFDAKYPSRVPPDL
ncbi:hypothetical protein [Burkholderia pseudomallei]|uniref:hypothetical protein n=1 Tax=Burkholderia pseudomallei TaxID=28450 RepID=UPI000F08FD58|nr:hypothetical protein [Burkholderia pseudomallei]VBI73263.1 Uncharacterised protein [Burkholderia pseudomallei]